MLNPNLMTFSQALCELKQGKFVAREGWNGKGMFIYLVNGHEVQYNDLRYPAKAAADMASEMEHGDCHSSRYVCGHIDMKNAFGQIVVGWLASQTDILAEDWIIIEPSDVQ
jgi:hypothetical protein